MRPNPLPAAAAAAVAAPPADPQALRAWTDEIIRISPFARWIGTRVGDIRTGRVVLQLPLRDELRQHHGQAHGAAIGYLADTACSWAAATVVGDVVTSEYKINLLAPARGDTLEAVGEVIRAGRRQVVARADVYALAGTGRELVATALATIATVQVRPAGDGHG